MTINTEICGRHNEYARVEVINENLTLAFLINRYSTCGKVDECEIEINGIYVTTISNGDKIDEILSSYNINITDYVSYID